MRVEDNTGESRPRSITEYLLQPDYLQPPTAPSQSTSHFPIGPWGHVHASCDVSSHLLIVNVCFPFLFHSQRQHRVVTSTHCVAQVLERTAHATGFHAGFVALILLSSLLFSANSTRDRVSSWIRSTDIVVFFVVLRQ